MIAIMTDEGALEFGRSLSGGSRFLAWDVALLDVAITELPVALALNSSDVDLIGNRIKDWDIVHLCECTGALPVQVSEGSDRIMAIDLDFNGQLGTEDGGSPIKYQTVVALGRRFLEYKNVRDGETYNEGDHVFVPGDSEHAYMCLTDNFLYEGVSPASDTDNWMAIDTSSLDRYPGHPELYADPRSDAVPFFVTSYDGAVTMANGMEWEYKVRVFLDNITTDNIAKLDYFSRGGLEGQGSVGLTFLASISELFRKIRDQASTSA